MHTRTYFLLLALAAAGSAQAQLSTATAPSSDIGSPTASLISTQVATVLTGGVAVADVTLSGSVTMFVGSDRKSGSVTMLARGTGQGRVDMNLSDSSRTDLADRTTDAEMCGWTIDGGKFQAGAFHNCLTDAAWFFPALSSLTDLTSTNLHLEDLGTVAEEGLSLRHLRMWRTTNRATKEALATLTRLSTMDFYLDPVSLLPLTVRFNVHPDNDAGRDVPIEVRYADYRNISGIQVPFRIQKLMNGNLLLDITVSDAKLNTGLTDSAFSVQ